MHLCVLNRGAKIKQYRFLNRAVNMTKVEAKILRGSAVTPEYLRDPELSIDNFRRQLKTFLFAQY